MENCVNDGSMKARKGELHTFEELQIKLKQCLPQKDKEQLTNEVTMMKQMLQLKPVGQDVSI